MAERSLVLTIDSTQAVAGARRFSRATHEAERGARGAARGVRELETGFSGLAKSRALLLGGGGLFAAFSGARLIGDTVSAIRDYEEAMSRAASVTGHFGGRMDEASELASRLGATTLFSASEVAQGMAFLGQAGFEADEIFASLEDTLNLATAGAIGLGEAADIASNVLSQFNLEAAEMARVADVIANTAASSNVNVRQLAESMKFAGTIAPALGESLEDVSAAIGVLGNSGIQGSEAGTQLRRVMLQLTSVTGEGESILRRYRLTQGDVSVATNDFIDVLKTLRDAQLGAADASQLIGVRGIAAFRTLTSNVDVLEELANANRAAEGASRRMAAVMADNLSGSFREFASAVEAIQNQIGAGGLSGSLRSVTDTATGVLRVFAGMGDTLGSQQEEFEALAGKVELAAKAFGVLLAGRFLVALNQRAIAIGANTVALVGHSAAATTAAASSSVAAQAELALSSAALTNATSHGAAAAAMLRYETAAAGAATASAAAASRASIMGRAFAALGGPAGVVILAAQALAFYALTQRDASDSADDLLDRIERQRERFAALQRTAAQQIEFETGGTLRQLDDEIKASIGRQAALLGDLEEAQRAASAGPGASGLGVASAKVLAIEAAISSEHERQVRLVEAANGLREDSAALARQRRAEEEALSALGAGSVEVDAGVSIGSVSQDIASATRQLEIELAEAAGRPFEALRLQVAEDLRAVEERTKEATARVDRAAAEARQRAVERVTAIAASEDRKVEQKEIDDAALAATQAFADEKERILAESERQITLTKELAGHDRIALADRLAEDELRETERQQRERERLFEQTAAGQGVRAFGNSLSELTRAGADFEDVGKRLAQTILEIGIQALVVKPLIDSLSDSLSAGPAGGGGFGGIGGIVGRLFGGLLGYPHGGSFTVPGSGGGGQDNKIVAFAASGGENIRVEPPRSGARAGGAAPVNITINTPPGTTATTRETTGPGGARDIEVFIKETMKRDVEKRGDFFRTLTSAQQGPTR